MENETNINGYELSRSWFNFCFDNPELIRPIHTAIYFFAIEHCNRLGWKTKFGFPSQMVMEAVGVKNWRTYSKALIDLVEFGFVEMIEISKNQYSSNIIAIVKNTKAPTKALDKALSKHSTKHSQSTVSINKQYNKEQYNKEPKREIIFPFESNKFIEFWNLWKEYKQTEHKFKYKSEISEQASLKKLASMSNNNEDKAIEILEDAIANGYKGFFQITKNNNNGKESISDKYDRLGNEYFASKYGKGDN